MASLWLASRLKGVYHLAARQRAAVPSQAIPPARRINPSEHN